MKLESEPLVGAERVLKRTRSRCPVCHASCPAEVRLTAGTPAKVFLWRNCPTHGEASVCIASDARFYWLAKGNPVNAQACCSNSVGDDVRRLNLFAGGQSLLHAPKEGPNAAACCSASGS